MFSLVRPGGIIALQEFDSASYVCYPEHPSWNILLGIWNETFHAVSGGNEFVGRSLGRLLRSAGAENVRRFVIPVHDTAGILLAYCGRAVKDESPLLLFPNGFDPRVAIFNANRVIEGDLYLVRDPLQVLTAYESGIENVVAFLTENVTALQLEQLAALMDERKCEHLEVF